MGLDPPTTSAISSLLYNLAASNAPRIILGLRPQDLLPDWITHLVYLDSDHTVAQIGPRDVVLNALRAVWPPASLPNNSGIVRSEVMSSSITCRYILIPSIQQAGRDTQSAIFVSNQNINQSEDGVSEVVSGEAQHGNSQEALIEMSGVEVKYGEKQVLGAWEQMVDGKPERGFWWTVKRGSRWGIFGPNGTSPL